MHSKFKAVIAIGASLGAVAAPAFAESVGGGVWNHGVNYSFPTSKTVYSNYNHSTKDHSGTSVCGTKNNTTYKARTQWANSSASCGIGSDTAAYWNAF